MVCFVVNPAARYILATFRWYGRGSKVDSTCCSSATHLDMEGLDLDLDVRAGCRSGMTKAGEEKMYPLGETDWAVGPGEMLLELLEERGCRSAILPSARG